MKKRREAEYTVCDNCEKEVTSTVICAKCNSEVCGRCYKDTPFASHCICVKCYGSNLKQICAEFEKEWEALMEQRDLESTALFDKYKELLEGMLKK